jgi:hypothetical protein
LGKTCPLYIKKSLDKEMPKINIGEFFNDHASRKKSLLRALPIDLAH